MVSIKSQRFLQIWLEMTVNNNNFNTLMFGVVCIFELYECFRGFVVCFFFPWKPVCCEGHIETWLSGLLHQIKGSLQFQLTHLLGCQKASRPKTKMIHSAGARKVSVPLQGEKKEWEGRKNGNCEIMVQEIFLYFFLKFFCPVALEPSD